MTDVLPDFGVRFSFLLCRVSLTVNLRVLSNCHGNTKGDRTPAISSLSKKHETKNREE